MLVGCGIVFTRHNVHGTVYVLLKDTQPNISRSAEQAVRTYEEGRRTKRQMDIVFAICFSSADDDAHNQGERMCRNGNEVEMSMQLHCYVISSDCQFLYSQKEGPHDIINLSASFRVFHF